MSLDPIITVNITRNTSTPTRRGFGVPACVAYFPTSIFSEPSRTYTSLGGMADDGFKSGDPAYKMAAALLSQNPSPPEFKIARRTAAPQQVVTWTPNRIPELGETIRVGVTGPTNAAFADREYVTTEAVLDIASGPPADNEALCTLMAGAFTLAATTSGFDYTAVVTGTGAAAKVEITADNTDASNDGMLYGYTPDANGYMTDNTQADSGLGDNLQAILEYDSDFYGICLDSSSSAEILIVDEFASANDRLFVAQTQDGEAADTSAQSDTTSILAQLVALNTDATMAFFHRGNLDYVSAAMLGNALPEDAGSITWAYRELQGVFAQNLTDTQVKNVLDKNANVFVEIAGLQVTRDGKVSSGEYTDIVRGVAWLKARMQERIYALLVQSPKLPYTDDGIQAVKSEVLSQLSAGIARDFIAADPEPTCDVPRAVDVSPQDKGDRILRDVFFRATLAGAIHYVRIEGELQL